MHNQDAYVAAVALIEECDSRHDIVEISKSLTELRKNGRSEYCGPCPVCKAGDDRFFVVPKSQKAACRKCGKAWGPTRLYAAALGIKAVEAARQLLGDAPVRTKPKTVARERHQEEPVHTEPQWQAEAKEMLAAAALPAESWRGLSVETLKAFSCKHHAGKFDPKYGKNRPAMVIPWLSADGLIYNLKFRFTNERPGLRFLSKAGGYPIVFGEQMLAHYTKVLIIEGEVNAMSIWQECCTWCDVLCIGSQSNDPSKEYIAKLIANRGYDEALVWFDDVAVAEQFCELITDAIAKPFSPPVVGSKALDANDMLGIYPAGLLGEIVAEAFASHGCYRCSGKGFEIVDQLIIPCKCKAKEGG